MIKSQASNPLTFDQAKDKIKSRFPGVFDCSLSLTERVKVIMPYEEFLCLFQSIEVFSAIGHDNWVEFTNISQDAIYDGFMLLYHGKISDCKALLAEQFRLITAEPALQPFTFSGMRNINGLIPDHLLVTGKRAELHFCTAELKPKDRPDLCRIYYCLSVYEKFKRAMVRSEELERKLENIFSMSMEKNLSSAIYGELFSSTLTELVRFMDALVIPVAGNVISDEFQDPFGLLRFFRAFVNKCLEKWANKSTTKIYAPCTAICQSSGFGKTKLLLESGQRHFHVIYLCLREEHSPSRLKRTPMIADLFYKDVREEEQQQFYSRIYTAIFKVLTEFIEAGQVNPASTNIVENITGVTADYKLSTYQPFWQRVKEAFEEVRSCMKCMT